MKTLVILMSTLLMLAISFTVSAQSSASATATVTIVAPLALSMEQKGDIAFSEVSNPSIIGLETSLSRIQKLSSKSTSQRFSVANFEIASAEPYAYAITSPLTIKLAHSSGLQQVYASATLRATTEAQSIKSRDEKFELVVDLNIGDMIPGGLYTATPFAVVVHHN